MDKNIVIVGGNGFLGRCLTRFMIAHGWAVRVVARNKTGVAEGATYFLWDGVSEGDWMQAFEGAHAVVNLAGRTVNCRYNEKNKKQIFDSRTRTTELVGIAIQRANSPPRVWLNSSTATIYRHAEDKPQTDEEGELGTGFSVEVAKVWEKTFFENTVTVRKVALRTAIVMGDDPDTVFDVLAGLAKNYLGGKMGSGTQMVSWIHVEDFCRAILWFIENEEKQGSYNLSAPNPITNRELMQSMREYVDVAYGLPATKWMLEIGAFFMRTETELILKSRWVLPTRLQKEGFTFEYQTFDEVTESFR